MKFVIGPNNLKLFAKSVLTLSKIGDEIYLEPLQNSLTLRTVNSSRSAFVYFSFKQSFFIQFEPELKNKTNSCLNTSYQPDQSNSTSPKGTTSKHQQNDTTSADITEIEDSDVFKCKIPAKCLLSIFKNINSLEKNVEKCTITAKYVPLSQETAAKIYDYDSTMISKKVNKNNEEQLYDIKFLVIMSCKHGLRKTFILSISDCENLQAAFAAQNCTNKLNISAKYLNETVNCFSNDTEEVSFIVETNKLYIKNYIELENGDSKSLINTQVSFDSDEFNVYEIEKETDITFCLKEFKVCLQFGTWFDLSLDIYFKKKGRPIIFLFNGNNSYEASFTLATLNEDLINSQTISSMSSNNTSINNLSNFDMNNTILTKATNGSKFSTTKQNVTSSSTTTSTSAVNAKSINSNKNLINDKSLTISKGNKRTLFDASNNQVFLNESLDTVAGSKVLDESNRHTTTTTTTNKEDSDEEDALLTQALNEQEAKTSDLTNTIASSTTPPAKKMKSLVQTLFEDDENDYQDYATTTTTTTTTKITTVATTATAAIPDRTSKTDINNLKVKKISFANLLDSINEKDSSLSLSNHEQTKNNPYNSIYIENTSSEDDDDDTDDD